MLPHPQGSASGAKPPKTQQGRASLSREPQGHCSAQPDPVLLLWAPGPPHLPDSLPRGGSRQEQQSCLQTGRGREGGEPGTLRVTPCPLLGALGSWTSVARSPSLANISNNGPFGEPR